MSYSEEQQKIARSLLGTPKTLEELREELGVPANELLEALKGLIELKVVERADQSKYKLIDEVLTGVEKQKGGASMEQEGAGGAYKVKMIIEGASRSKEALEFQINEIEKKLRKEKYHISKLEKSSVKEQEGDDGTFTMFIDTEISTPSLKDVVYLIINYGPSYIELLEPKKVEISMADTQDMLNEILQAVHYYVNFIFQLQQKHMDAEKEKAGSEG